MFNVIVICCLLAIILLIAMALGVAIVVLRYVNDWEAYEAEQENG